MREIDSFLIIAKENILRLLLITAGAHYSTVFGGVRAGEDVRDTEARVHCAPEPRVEPDSEVNFADGENYQA
jgi:hypothetical protein